MLLPHHQDIECPRKILVIEDSPMILKPLASIIRESGFEPIVAMSLADVKKILLKHQQDIFAAVADYCLPDALTGEVIPTLLDVSIPTVVLTGHADLETRDKVLSLPVVDYVSKESPAALEYVVKILNRLIRNPEITVLVVDDAITMRKYLRQLLERQLYRVVEADRAQMGLQFLAQDDSIRLVLTDQDMPGMDGMRFSSEIRRRYGYHRLSIIGISGLDNPVISARFIKAGADDFMHKPFSPEEFFCRITRNIEFTENIQALERAAHYDALTGLSNRHHFLELMRKIEGEFCVGICDIDSFKSVNDTYGHDVGDHAIRLMAGLLQESFPDGITSRFGGEEFVVVIPNNNIIDFVSRLNDMRTSLSMREITTTKGNFTIRMSAGVSIGGKDISLSAALKAADQALYAAKEGGRNRVCLAE